MEESEKEDLGSILSRRRQERGISLEDAAAGTKIKIQFLRALEENRFDLIPGETYLFGFLRAYGRFLGLPPEDLLRRYQAQIAAARGDAQPPETKRGGPKYVWILGAVLILVFIVVVLLLRNAQEEAPQPPVPPAVEEEAEDGPTQPPPAAPATGVQETSILPLPAPAEPVGESSSPVESAANPRILRIVPLGGGILRMQALGPGALEIWLDARPSQRYALQADTQLSWRVTHSARLQMENPAAVRLWIDAAPIDFAANPDLLLQLHQPPETLR